MIASDPSKCRVCGFLAGTLPRLNQHPLLDFIRLRGACASSAYSFADYRILGRDTGPDDTKHELSQEASPIQRVDQRCLPTLWI